MGGIGGKGKGRKRRTKVAKRLEADPLRKRRYSAQALPEAPNSSKEEKLPRKLREIEWARLLPMHRSKRRSGHAADGRNRSSKSTRSVEGASTSNSNQEDQHASDATVTAFRMGWNDAASVEVVSTRGKKGAKPAGSRVKERVRRKASKELRRDVASAALPAEDISLHDVATAPPPSVKPTGASKLNQASTLSKPMARQEERSSSKKSNSNRLSGILQKQFQEVQQFSSKTMNVERTSQGREEVVAAYREVKRNREMKGISLATSD